MNWEKCREFGVVEINYSNNTVKLYYNQFGFCLAGNPLFLEVESATWQGNSLILRGYDRYGVRMVYVMQGFNSYQQIV